MAERARATRILTQIDSRSWEHPADRATLNALRKIPGFDEVLRALFGFFGERGVRLAFQANAVRASPTQFARVHRLYGEVARTLDAPAEYPVFVTQSPVYNAMAYGMDQPFIVVHSSLAASFDDDELRFVLGHELGHIMSGHVLYTTMMELLTMLAWRNFPIVGLAAGGILLALREWHRKAELSCDRAGILAVQDPEPGLQVMLKFAGGASGEANLAEFIRQSDEYCAEGELPDQVYKVLNVLNASHPFPVIRVAEMRTWFASGAYERIIAGEYRRRGEPDRAYTDDVQEAARAYSEAARDTFGKAAGAAQRVVDSFRSGFGR